MKRTEAPIASPCHEDWDGMDGDARSRFCGQCSKSVHHLSDMTEAAAVTLLADTTQGRLCVRYRYRPDNNQIVFRDSPAPARSRLARTARRLAVALPLLAAPALAAASGSVEVGQPTGCEQATAPTLADRTVDKIVEILAAMERLVKPAEQPVISLGQVPVQMEVELGELAFEEIEMMGDVAPPPSK
jgi:hypothetical protein